MPEKIELTPEAIAAAEKKGAEAERARVAALNRWIDADPNNEKVAQIVKEAIATGKTEAEVQPQILVAVRDGAKAEGGKGPENPPRVRTQTSAGASAGGEVEEDPSSWSDETIKAKGHKIAAAMKGSNADNGLVIHETIRIRG